MVYKDILKDVKYLVNIYGEIDDFCGGFCNCEIFYKLLENPDTKTATEIQIKRIECIIGKLTEEQKENDKKIQSIIKKYSL